MNEETKLSYFTDGSADPNPGEGGFAVIKNGQAYIIGGERFPEDLDNSRTTNIRMEATAILTALEDAAGQKCTITTDSQFWINVLTKWAPGWEKRGWTKKSGPIKNLELVKRTYNAYTSSEAQLIWTRGHVGTELNEKADHWAKYARQHHLSQPVKVADLADTE